MGDVAGWSLRLGLDGDRRKTRTDGRVPSQGGDFAGIGGVAGFTIDRSRLAGRCRRRCSFDGSDRSRRSSAHGSIGSTASRRGRLRRAPRSAGSSRRTVLLRFAWGRYHQGPAPNYFDAERGATTLRPMEATHYVAGYERGQPDEPLFFRAEAYWKQYQSLPIEDTRAGFTSEGYGTARGIDLFVRRIWPRLDLRLSAASCTPVAAGRRPSNASGTRCLKARGLPTSRFPIRGPSSPLCPWVARLAVAGTWRVAAGRPFTPIRALCPRRPAWRPSGLRSTRSASRGTSVSTWRRA